MLACNANSNTNIINSGSSSSNFFGIGHNEDGWNGTYTTGYFVNATVTDASSYFAFQYPGYLAGNAFGINNYSLALTVNSLFPLNVSITNSRGIYFIARSILDCPDLQCVTNAITGGTQHNHKQNKQTKKNKKEKEKARSSSTPVSTYGASFNVGLRQEKVILNAEISNFEYNIENCSNYGYHFNNYVRILDVAATDDISSDNRLDRTQELVGSYGGINTQDNIVDILGDTQNSDYPIYRDSKAPDDASTLATGVFDLVQGYFYIYEQCNPKECTPTKVVNF